MSKVTQVDYKETQIAHLCGNHAFNNLIQEKKLVWAPNKPLLLVNGEAEAKTVKTVKTVGVQINTWSFCKDVGLRHLKAQRQEYLEEDANRIVRQLKHEPSLDDEYYKKESNKKDFARDLTTWKKEKAKFDKKDLADIIAILDKEYGKDESLEQLEEGGIGCTMSGPQRGDIPYASFREIFDMLGYEYLEVDDLTWKDTVDTHLTSPGYLGTLINQGKWHYVSVPKYVTSNECPKRKYVLADSLKSDVFTCHTKRQLYKAMEALPVTRAFLVFAKNEEAYESVAVKRMLKQARRKKYTRKAHAKRLTQ